MSQVAALALCFGLSFLMTFVLSLFHLAFSASSKIALSGLLEDKPYRADVIRLHDEIEYALQFVRAIFLIAFLFFGFLLFPKSREWPLGFFLLAVAVYVLFFDGLPRLINSLTQNKAIFLFLPSYRIIHLLASPLFLISRRFRKPKTEEDDLRESKDEEIETFIDEAKEEGIIEKDEGHLLRGVVEFGDTVVREIMTPRVDMVCIRDDATIDKAREIVETEGYSRLPVYKDRIDNTEGVLLAKDLLKYFGEEHRTLPIKPLVRPTFFVPESMKVAQLLQELQKRKQKLAMVVDEHGGVSGLATMEDIVEEIVGEIQDEYDQEEPLVHQNGPADYTVSGEVKVEEVEDLFDSDLAEDDYITMSGFMTHHLGRLPAKGEVVSLKGFTLEVLDVNQKKVIKLRIRK